MRCREGFSDTMVFNATFLLQGSYLSLKSAALPTELRAQSERFAFLYITESLKGSRQSVRRPAHDSYCNCGCYRDPPQRR
jgi:hypothetical protein